METNEIKKVLYKEKPIAVRSKIYDNNDKDYYTETSLGRVWFHIPNNEQIGSENLFSDTVESHLLVRWLTNE